jgi:kynureninase
MAEPSIEIITPRNDAERGCQVSMRIVRNGKAVFEALLNAGVIADWREPDVIRVAPVPLYNTFEDVFHFGKIIEHQLLANA